MISKRSRRGAYSQENLKQFSLNNSKGIDETKPITDSDTVSSMENLTVNPDGSVSLRKRMLCVDHNSKLASGDVHLTHTGNHYIHISDNGFLGIFLRNSSEECTIKIVGREYYTHKDIDLSWDTSDTYFRFDNASFFNTSTTTVIGNCYVNAVEMDKVLMIDGALYDMRDDLFLPRYLQFEHITDKTGGHWKLTIINPEVNQLTTAEGEIPLNPNLCLDNPYAIRDSYNNPVPSIKGIVAYVQTHEHYNYNNISDLRVSDLTESCKDASFKAISTVGPDAAFKMVWLKAFCNMPSAGYNNRYYMSWEGSVDGVNWIPFGGSSHVPFKAVLESWKPSESVKEPRPNTDYYSRFGILINAKTAADKVESFSTFTSRPDIFPIVPAKDDEDGMLNPYNISMQYRCSIVTLVDRGNADGHDYYLDSTLSSQIFYYTPGNVTEYLQYDGPNAVLGDKLYNNRTIYSYNLSDNHPSVYVSDVDSYITPLYNQLDLRSEYGVVCTIPWRNYLLTCTPTTMYLASKVEGGFTTKTVSTAVGIPYEDRLCVKPALNGIIFKSSNAIYLAYPNLYSSDDSTLMLTEISKPISQILDETSFKSTDCFAEVVDDNYILMLNDADKTHCLVYNISTKAWEYYTYPVNFKKFFKTPSYGRTVASITSSGYCEYLLFEDNYSKVSGKLQDDAPDTYCDVLSVKTYEDGFPSDFITTPIHFAWDTGQKTDSIARTKQFVESKFVFATLSERDSFPFTLYVAIDGDPHVTKTDVSTDAPFWKPTELDPANPTAGVVGTAFRLGGADTPVTGAFNTLRQLVVRYSGKGKSIRHLIEGESQYNFKLYETYVRYKNLNGK